MKIYKAIIFSLFLFSPGILWSIGYVRSKGKIVLKSERLKILVKDQIARIEIEQLFHNGSDSAADGQYELPLNDEGVVYEFAHYKDGRKIVAKVDELSRARDFFETQKRAGRVSSLGERKQPNLFKMEFSALKPGEERRISIKILEILPYDSGAALLRLRVGEGEKFSGKIERFSLFMEVEDQANIAKVFSPSHNMKIEKITAHKTRLLLEERGFKSDRDLLVYAMLESDKTRAKFISQGGLEEARGYFLFSLTPPEKSSEEKVVARSLTFVFDTSGSMRGAKIRQAKKALSFCLKNLSEKDHFRLVTFSSGVDELNAEFIRATPQNVKTALAFVQKIRAGGSTNIEAAMKLALKKDPQARPGTVIFMTDGRPTAGVTRIGQLLKKISAANSFAMKVFTFGVGKDLSRKLLNKMARSSRGYADYVRPGDSLEDKISLFFDRIKNPLWTDIALSFSGGPRISGVYPKVLPDLYKGSRLMVFGRHEGNGSLLVSLKAKGVEGEVKRAWEFSLSEDKSRTFISRLWAHKKIETLEENLDIHGAKGELIDEIKRLGKKYNLATRFTSFVDADEIPTQVISMQSQASGRVRRPTRGAFRPRMKAPGIGGSPPVPGRAMKNKSISLQSRSLKEETSFSAPAKSADFGMLADGFAAMSSKPMAPTSRRRGGSRKKSKLKVMPHDLSPAMEMEVSEFKGKKEQSYPVIAPLAILKGPEKTGLLLEYAGKVKILYAGDSFTSFTLDGTTLDNIVATGKLRNDSFAFGTFTTTDELKLFKIVQKVGVLSALICLSHKWYLLQGAKIIAGKYRVLNISSNSVQFIEIKTGKLLSKTVN
ncbi:VWA domain-containing protein [Candidatus Riflebacteria bacterium]